LLGALKLIMLIGIYFDTAMYFDTGNISDHLHYSKKCYLSYWLHFPYFLWELHNQWIYFNCAGLVIISFGPSYSYTLLKLLYGDRHSDREAPVLLRCYCFYIISLGMNGLYLLHPLL
jgi:hypothetical protein